MFQTVDLCNFVVNEFDEPFEFPGIGEALLKTPHFETPCFQMRVFEMSNYVKMFFCYFSQKKVLVGHGVESMKILYKFTLRNASRHAIWNRDDHKTRSGN